MTTEASVLRAVRRAVNLDGRVRLVRNNTGFDLERRVRYGLGTGGADLVGLIRATGRGIALEVKTDSGRLSRDQQTWLAAFRRCGGFAAVVRSPDEAIAAVDRACAGASE